MSEKKPENLEKPDYLGHRKRVREKFLSSKGKELHDYELLEILLFSVFPRFDTKPIAKNLLRKFGDISAVINADFENLKEVDKIGDSAVVALKINAEIINRVLRNKAKEKEVLSNYQSLLDYAKNSLQDLNYEVFRVIFLDANYRIIEDELMSIGENDFVQISVKNIVKKALLLHSPFLILMHNHPTSNLEASNSDIKTTAEIQKALNPLNIEIIDHLIIGKNGYFSFKENGIL